MEVRSKKAAQDYNMIRIFGCPAYYHVKEDKLNLQVKKVVFLHFKGGVKGHKLCDSKDKKIVVSKYIMFDEASMMKPTSFQQVKSGQTKEVCSGWSVMLLHILKIVHII